MGESARDRHVVVVKLGGSLITRKREVEKVRPKVLARLARELRDAGDASLVLLHGAGSFGHPGARRFGLASPPAARISAAERRRGAAVVAAEVRRLHLLTLRELVRSGACPWSTPPAMFARNREGRLSSMEVGPFEEALRQALVPVGFGDVVPDDAWGFSVLSADTLAVELARRLPVRRVIFASDVPGIYRDAPGASRTVAAEVTAELVEQLRPKEGAADVTGGIRAKAEAMRAIARAGADAVLISGLSDGALSRAIRGEAVYGSWAHASVP